MVGIVWRLFLPDIFSQILNFPNFKLCLTLFISLHFSPNLELQINLCLTPFYLFKTFLTYLSDTFQNLFPGSGLSPFLPQKPPEGL